MTEDYNNPDASPSDEAIQPSGEIFTGLDFSAFEQQQVVSEEDWPADDLESAYRRALEANEAVEWEFNQLPADDQTEPDAAIESESGSESSTVESDVEVRPARITPRQIIEAAIFVGGAPLTSKKLCYMFRGDYELDFIEDTIDDLNRQYLEEGRPYEIRLGEGGYRMQLRKEYDRVRNRVFGIGPREVKLSQEVLEVLAIVAYRQPITQKQIEALGKSNPGGMLRQLLRRELIAIERDPENRKQVKYVTSQRFLSLFGLGSLRELPEADELAFK